MKPASSLGPCSVAASQRGNPRAGTALLQPRPWHQNPARPPFVKSPGERAVPASQDTCLFSVPHPPLLSLLPIQFSWVLKAFSESLLFQGALPDQPHLEEPTSWSAHGPSFTTPYIPRSPRLECELLGGRAPRTPMAQSHIWQLLISSLGLEVPPEVSPWARHCPLRPFTSDLAATGLLWFWEFS